MEKNQIGHKCQITEGNFCCWCDKPAVTLDGKWPTGTWFQTRLAAVLVRKANEIAKGVSEHD